MDYPAITSKCKVCLKQFKSFSALSNHQFSTGHFAGRYCFKCKKLFSTENGKRNHCDAKHPDSSDSSDDVSVLISDDVSYDAPIENLNGKWIRREAFQGRKSFGKYQCSSCGNKWSSAHAFKEYGQQCRNCKNRAYQKPIWMWMNHGDKQEKPIENTEKPHDIERCQACLRGKCRGAR